MAHLKVDGLKTFHGGPYTFEVAERSRHLLSGPSGSGKTLILRSLADLDPHQGQIALDGRLQQDISPPLWRKSVAYLPVESAWWHPLVGEHFIHGDVQHAHKVGFEKDISSWAVERLSTGEKQRLAILRCLQNKPSFLLLDEPTANLDQKNVSAVESLLHNYQIETGAGALWTTHDSRQQENFGDEVIHINSDGSMNT